MKNKTNVLTLFSLALSLFLVACGPTADTDADAEPTAVATTEGEEITLFVGPELQECTGAAPQMCMMVKENIEDEYSYFYDQIEGFTHEAGIESELRVLVTPVENPPADSSSLKYTLVEIVNQTAVAPDGTTDGDAAMDSELRPLEATVWQLDSYYLDGDMVAALPETIFTFTGNQMAAATGCNNTSANFTAEGRTITFELGMSTMMFCGEAENGQEDALRVNIAAVASYQLDGDAMQMMDAEGNVLLQFSAIETPTDSMADETNGEAASLEGPTWQLESYHVDGEMVAALPGVLFIFEDGRMGGSTGCNNTSAEYTVNGQSISFGLGMSTMMSCGAELDAQENSIRANLDATVSYQIEGDQMQMMDADGNVTLRFSVQEPISLTDTIWQATLINNGTGGAASLVMGTKVTAVFNADNTLSGSAGCNSYNTSYEADGETISVSPAIAATRRACEEAVAAQENQYLTALGSAATYTIFGDTLELRGADGSLQVSYTAVTPVPFTDTTWEAISYNSGGQAVVSVISGTRLTAVFGNDGALNGTAGCNTYFGTYELDDDTISIPEEIAATAMACAAPEGVMAQEQAYLAALRTAATYTVSGNRMELRTSDGALAVSFVAAEPVSLVGSSWEVVGHNNGRGGVTSSIIGTEMTMIFDENGGVSGSAGCNRYFGSYEAGEETLLFSAIGSTEAFCAEPEGIMDQEAEFLTALATVAVYDIDGSTLTMRDKDGSTAVTLQMVGDME